MKARVVFIGPMASGKTKIAKRVAARMRASRLDTDKMIVANHGPIPQIFEQQGEPAFRAIERDAVAEALDNAEVVSLGGGAVLDAQTQELLKAAHVVYLTASADAIERRLVAGKRPLLTDGIASWQRIFIERKPVYESLASITLDTSHGRLDDIAEQVVGWIESDYTRIPEVAADAQQISPDGENRDS